MLTFDHLILAVPDLEQAAERLFDEHGLASTPGGRHAGHGTGNRVVPLGSEYLELLSVVDPAEAEKSFLGSRVQAAAARGEALFGLCLRAADVASHSRRLGRDLLPLERLRPDGRKLAWKLVALEDALGPERLPFFQQFESPPELHPGRERAPHRVHPRGIRRVGWGGPPSRLRSWLEEEVPGFEFVGGEPGPRWAEIETEAAVIRLGEA